MLERVTLRMILGFVFVIKKIARSFALHCSSHYIFFHRVQINKMLQNQNTILSSQSHSIFLVPYRKEHVPIYHEWMKDPYLLAMTASEPLSLQEEYEMQNKWTFDKDSKS